MRCSDATNNELQGALPGGGAMPPRLNTLLLQNNQLAGSLPPRLGRLQYLSLGSNQLTGTLPPSWSEHTGLMSLKLGDNALRGPLPPEWSTLGGLKFLELQNNALTGQLPPQVGTPEHPAVAMRSPTPLSTQLLPSLQPCVSYLTRTCSASHIYPVPCLFAFHMSTAPSASQPGRRLGCMHGKRLL